MKPELLIISGWGPYKDKIEIDFTRFGSHGLFLISGPTGAGKTTIFDAISYALFGEVSGSMRTKDGVRSDFANAETKTYVNLTMTHRGRKYVIERNPQYNRPKKRKTGESTFTKESENAILHLPADKTVEGNREVNSKIQEILGMDFEQFKQLSMIAQGEFARLLTANSREKTQIFRKIFSTYQYEQFSMNLSQKAKELYGKIMTYHNRMDETIETILPVIQGYVSAEEWERFLQEEAAYRKQYDRVREYLEQVWKISREQGRKAEQALEKAERELLSQEKQMQQATADNQLFEEYEKAIQEQERLTGLQPQMEDSQKTLDLARGAEKLEGAYLFREESHKHLDAQIKKIRLLEKEIVSLEERERSYRVEYEHRDALRELLQEMTSYLEDQQQYQQKEKVHEKKKKELSQLQQQFLRLEQETDSLKKKYENMEHAMRHAMAGILAEQLQEGSPCPVCGATEHPKIASVADNVPDEKQIQQQKEQYEQKNQQLMTLHGKTSALHGEVKTEEETLNSLSHALDEKQAHITQISDIMSVSENEQAQLAQDERRMAVTIDFGEVVKCVSTNRDIMSVSKKDERRMAVTKCVSTNRDIMSVSKQDEQRMAVTKCGTPDDCRKALARLEEHCSQMQQIMADKKAKTQMLDQLYIEENAQREQLKKTEKKFLTDLKKAGFDTEEQYLACKKTTQEIQRLQKEIDGYAQSRKSNIDYVNRMKKTLKGKEKVQMESLLQSRKDAEEKKKQAASQLRKMQVQSAQLKAAASSMKEKIGEVTELEQSYGIIKDLDNLTMGNNGKRLVFEQYVLISYFEEVLHAANSRLQKMTAGRFQLSRVEGVSDGRTRDNFELQVLDNYTGKYRLARTLSGGESFKASLSLALGMSDIIQAANGGISVETLFIDEGFGSLDSESLDMACETLLSLVDKDRLIGIISHVTELQERIPKQLVVTKTNVGSTVHVAV